MSHDDAQVKTLYLKAVDTATQEGFDDRVAFDFGGWVAERVLSGEFIEKPMIDLFREFQFEKRSQSRERLEAAVRILKHCGSLSDDAGTGCLMKVSRAKLLELAKSGAGFDGIAKVFGIPPARVGTLLMLAKEPKEWLEISV